MPSPPDRTIDEVIEELDRVVRTCRVEELRAGYFAALYRRVTVAVRDWIRAGRFEDGPRMERLDVLFADRYLAAWRAGRPVTLSWRVAFDASEKWWPITLQHLLLGMNAHINLDLGIATARTARRGRIDELHADFLTINRVLASVVEEVQERLARVWPLLRLVDGVAGGADEAVIRFSLTRARDAAWLFATRLDRCDPSEWGIEIEAVDRFVSRLGHRIERPGRWLGPGLRFVRLGELRSTRGIIDLLQALDPDAVPRG